MAFLYKIPDVFEAVERSVNQHNQLHGDTAACGRLNGENIWGIVDIDGTHLEPDAALPKPSIFVSGV